MAPPLNQAVAALEPAVRFLKVDFDVNPMWAAKLGVRGIPSLFVIQGGKVVAQRSETIESSSLQSWVRSAAGLR